MPPLIFADIGMNVGLINLAIEVHAALVNCLDAPVILRKVTLAAEAKAKNEPLPPSFYGEHS